MPILCLFWHVCDSWSDQPDLYLNANDLIQFIIWFNKISANHSCTPIILFHPIPNGMKWILSSDSRMTLVSLYFRVPCANPNVASGICVRTNAVKTHARTHTHMQCQQNLFTLFFGYAWFESVLETMICNQMENSVESQRKKSLVSWQLNDSDMARHLNAIRNVIELN